MRSHIMTIIGGRRQRPILAFGALVFVALLYQSLRYSGLSVSTTSLQSDNSTTPIKKVKYNPGKPFPANHNYTKTLVMARTSWENVDWIYRDLHGFNYSIYLMNSNPMFDADAQHVPANKGHESMAYLTYIIDNYDHLPDVSLFFHPHRSTWHNNVLMDLDSAVTISRLNPANVQRVGYFNARCHHDPGCPDWHHPNRPESEYDIVLRKEEKYLNPTTWTQLHGSDPVPYSISTPCCAQFAVSRSRILARPRSDYEHYRTWLLNTELTDEFSGRVLEYNWQYIFTGQAEYCPSQARCYCDGYGICFGGSTNGENFEYWLKILREHELLEEDIKKWRGGQDMNGRFGGDVEAADRNHTELVNKINRLKDEAFERGKDPKARAKEAGRKWKEGDGF